MPHEHQWGRGYREVDVPVIDGVATMPDGRTIASTANIVRFTVAQLNDMADAAIQGQTPPPLSFNENVLLMALYRQRLEATR